MTKVLVCGSRGVFKDYKEFVFGILGGLSQDNLEIIEGCCKSSADEYAESYALVNNVKIRHFPSGEGNYIKRNVDMVNACDEVIAFWDGWSYGTAHTIATAVLQKKTVWVLQLEKEDNHISLKKFI